MTPETVVIAGAFGIVGWFLGIITALLAEHIVNGGQ